MHITAPALLHFYLFAYLKGGIVVGIVRVSMFQRPTQALMKKVWTKSSALVRERGNKSSAQLMEVGLMEEVFNPSEGWVEKVFSPCGSVRDEWQILQPL